MANRRTEDRTDEYAKFLIAFGLRLSEVRRRAGLNQDELGARIGCTGETVGRYERGESFPRIEVLLRLRKELRVSLDYLVVGMSVGTIRDARLLRRLQDLDALPAERVNEVLRLLDMFLSHLGDAHAPERKAAR